MENKSTVCIGIIVLNSQIEIKNCIQSSLKQTHFVNEILIVDDGCTENTIEEIKNVSTNIKLLEMKKTQVYPSQK